MFRIVTSMCASAAVASAASAAFAALAAAGPALDSDACHQALDRLGVQETRAASAPAPGRAPSAPLLAAQRQAALACLGGANEPTPTTPRQAQPVLVLPRPMPLAVPRLALPPPTPAAPPIALPQPPAFVTACDATGCWGSDGARLDRVGPDLYLRNHQLCNARGGLLQCP